MTGEKGVHIPVGKKEEGAMLGRLGMNLLVWFLLLSLVPLSIVGIISYQKAKKSLYDQALNSLSVATKLKTAYIHSYITHVETELTLQSMLNSNKRFLNLVSRSFRASEMPLTQFVKSDTWEMVTEFDSRDLRAYEVGQEIDDLIFLDNEGNILYTTQGEKDLGTNIFSGEYAGTRLGKACRDALEKKDMVYSDIERYPPIFNDLAYFLVNPILGKDKKPLGILAFRLSLAKIDKILKDQTGLGKSGETYLVGKDFLMRSNSRFLKDDTILSMRVDSTLTKNWVLHLGEKREGEKTGKPGGGSGTGAGIYENYRGEKVVGMYETLKIAGTDMAVIGEIGVREAFAPAKSLGEIMAILLAVTGLVVLLISVILTRKIVDPVRRLSDWARRVASGNLSVEEIKTPDNEIGNLYSCFIELVRSFQEVADVSEGISKGNFSRTLTIRSDQDILGESVNMMCENLRDLVNKANMISAGEHSIKMTPLSEDDELGVALYNMTETLKETIEENRRQNWLKSGKSGVNDAIRGEPALETLGEKVVKYIVEYLNAQMGALYVRDNEDCFTLCGSYAMSQGTAPARHFESGEGLVGQVAKDGEMRVLSNPEGDEGSVRTGFMNIHPSSVLLSPLKTGDDVRGVIEIASTEKFSDREIEFITRIGESIAIGIASSMSREKMKDLLGKTQKQAVELQGREEDLGIKNRELEEQTRALKLSEERLQSQQEELRQINEELEEQTMALKESEIHLQKKQEELKRANRDLMERAEVLETQKEEIRKINEDIEKAHRVVEEKAKALELSGKYKSEFLANMSHELRTPLNSIIVLSQLLGENKEGTLSHTQVEFAHTIHGASKDLLSLINDVLDLSKVEAGKMDLDIERVSLMEFASRMEMLFGQVAVSKGISFDMVVETGIPEWIETDRGKVEQIVKNLLSNAFKFTGEGGVTVTLRKTPGVESSVTISVADTGIGIAEKKLQVIFEAFQQEDGGTSREYGGTGLGLSISLKLAKLLGGDLSVQSEKGRGCEFILALPERFKGMNEELRTEEKTSHGEGEGENEARRVLVGEQPLRDDRNVISEGDSVLLMIGFLREDSRLLLHEGRSRGYMCLIAEDGVAGEHFADFYTPSGIVINLDMEGEDGMALLHTLGNLDSLDHVPLVCVSETEGEEEALAKGAKGWIGSENMRKDVEPLFGLLKKRSSSLQVRILGDRDIGRSVSELLGNGELTVSYEGPLDTGASHCGWQSVDCLILAPLPGRDDLSCYLQKFEAEFPDINTPTIVYSSGGIDGKGSKKIDGLSSPRRVRVCTSPEELQGLFLHRGSFPDNGGSPLFEGKTALVVDDDMRNVFALTSLLEREGMRVIIGKDGRESLECIRKNPETDIVLMDIMMPEMNGFDAICEIRKEERFEKLPIIAVTAKAMKGDRDKCIKGGADDYLAKPVDNRKLLSIMKVWLNK